MSDFYSGWFDAAMAKLQNNNPKEAPPEEESNQGSQLKPTLQAQKEAAENVLISEGPKKNPVKSQSKPSRFSKTLSLYAVVLALLVFVLLCSTILFWNEASNTKIHNITLRAKISYLEEARKGNMDPGNKDDMYLLTMNGIQDIVQNLGRLYQEMHTLAQTKDIS